MPQQLATIDPSKDVLRIIGCVPSNQDRDIWPAYGGLIILETGNMVTEVLQLRSTADDACTGSDNHAHHSQAIARQH